MVCYTATFAAKSDTQHADSCRRKLRCGAHEKKVRRSLLRHFANYIFSKNQTFLGPKYCTQAKQFVFISDFMSTKFGGKYPCLFRVQDTADSDSSLM